MGILKEMFSEESGEFEKRPAVLLAKGRYVSDSATIMEGYKTFQLRYVLKSLILKMLLVLCALASSIFMLVSSERNDAPMSVLFILICVCLGVYFINEPVANRRKLKSGLEQLEGVEYEAEITDRYIKISTIEDENAEMQPVVEAEEDEISDENTGGEEESEEDKGPPATVIHLDSNIVDFIDKEEMFIVCVKKSYVFIIPKSAFSEDDVQKTIEKLSAVMGIRFKIAD